MQTERTTSLVELSVNTIRGLSMDAVEKAKSGHPGLPMGAAAIGYALFARHLRFDPEAPHWFNRDRFVLSAGHGSMLLYSLLHLTGYAVSLDDLKRFRQWGSLTPGHPENTLTPGVEMATGPLGQGVATAVGMAIAESRLRAEFKDLVNHWTYVLCSDGDLMEGLSSEAASLAGHLRLDRLIYLYDHNRVTIDGSTDLAFSEDVARRYESYGWSVFRCDGLDVDAVDEAISVSKESDLPSLIICDTVIGYGSPGKAGSSAAHGAPLGNDEVLASKRALGIPDEPLFYVPEEVASHMRELGLRCREERLFWESAVSVYPELLRRIAGDFPAGWSDNLPSFSSESATRAHSGAVLNALSTRLPELMGGSADLTESNQTTIVGGCVFSISNRLGRNLHFGVREHAMAAAVNGMNLHGGIRAYGGTFLVFSDYMRPSIRLSALMEVASVFVFTHDSIGLGEDGPTHQPVEHLMSLRAIPNLWVFRPADGNETCAAWISALSRKQGPAAIALTRQKVRSLDSDVGAALRGGYVLRDCDGLPDLILIGTGSEVGLCVSAYEILLSAGVRVRVVSLPCWELFESQDVSYRASVLPAGCWRRISVEAGVTLGWSRYVGDRGVSIGLDRFGASAPYEVLYEKFGLTVDNVLSYARWLLDTE